MSKQSSTPTFAQLGVAIEITDALDSFGIQHTFAIQELTLPLALDGIDLIGQARTGQGKTLGFGVPLLDRIFDSADIAELDGTPRAPPKPFPCASSPSMAAAPTKSKSTP